MKKLVVLLFLFSAISLSSMDLFPTQQASIKDHLLEINKEWNQHLHLLDLDLDQAISFSNDDERIQFHLLQVIHLLNQSSSKETPNALKRVSLIQELHSYAEEKLFPRNYHHNHRHPFFIDKDNRACAVGHLMLKDGQTKFVNEIKTSANQAYIKEIKDLRLNAWAFANGFSIDELALIQPGYPSTQLNFSQVGNGVGPNGNIHAMVADLDDKTLFLAGNFTSFDNIDAECIVSWDGENLKSLDSGIEGIIYDMDVSYDDLLYVVGKFDLKGQKNVNIAMWDGKDWFALQDHDMEGTIYAIEASSSRIYVGGDFDNIAGKTVSNLAFYDSLNKEWSTDGASNTEAAFSVNGPVYDFELIEGKLLVAGAFTQTANLCSDPEIAQLDTRYLSYWTYYDWEVSFSGDYAEIHKLHHKDGNIYIGGDLNQVNSFAKNYAGFWTYYNEIEENFVPQGNGHINGFLEIEDQVFAYGGFSFYPFVGNFTTNLYPVAFSEFGINQIDNSILAAAKFQNNYYLAGDFTEIEGEALSSIVKFNIDPSSNENIGDQPNKINVYSNDDLLILEGEMVQGTQILLYDFYGRQVLQQTLNYEKTYLEIQTSNYLTGSYFYVLHNEDLKQEGKFIKI